MQKKREIGINGIDMPKDEINDMRKTMKENEEKLAATRASMASTLAKTAAGANAGNKELGELKIENDRLNTTLMIL